MHSNIYIHICKFCDSAFGSIIRNFVNQHSTLYIEIYCCLEEKTKKNSLRSCDYVTKILVLKMKIKVRGPANFALPQMGGNVVNHVIRSQMHDFGDVREVEVQQLLKDENRENSHASVEKEAPLQFHNAALMNKETLVTSGSGVLVSGAGNSTFLNESSVFDQSISPLLSESAILEPLHLPESLNGLQIDKLREEIESAESEFGSASVQVNGSVRLQEDSVSDSGLHVVTDPSKLNGHLVAELHGHETEKRELGEEGEITSYSFLLGESERKDLHMFYDKSKLDRKIIAKINGHKSFSPDASVLDSKTLSASFKDTILKGGEVSARIPPLKAGNLHGSNVT